VIKVSPIQETQEDKIQQEEEKEERFPRHDGGCFENNMLGYLLASVRSQQIYI